MKKATSAKNNPATADFEILVEDYNVTPFIITRLNFVMAKRVDKFIKNPPQCFCEFTGKRFNWHTETTKWDKFGKETSVNVFKNPKKWIKFNKQFRKDTEKLKAKSSYWFAENFSKYSSARLWKTYLEACELYEKVYEQGIIPTIADLHYPFFTENLKKILKKHTSAIEDAFVKLTTPFEMSDLLKEERGLLELAQDKNIKKNSQKITTHHRKYFWLTFGYEGPAYGINEIWDKISLLKNDTASQIRFNELRDYGNKIKKETSKLIKKLGFNKKTSAIFEIARDWVLLKEARKESFFACYASMDKLAEEIAKRLNTEKIQIKYLTKEELKSVLFKNIFPEDIKNRCKKSIYAYADGKDIIYTDHDAEKYLKKYKKAESLKNNTGTIKGQVAYKGIVTGKVKIIREPSDMEKMEIGDILVSPATNPNLLPAMKKASAFITDVGGITCHAAIVARELKTPCVIGTKIATRVLRDGDMVEVDADNGIVKIISAH